MSVSRLKYLFDRYFNHHCDASELAELMNLIALPENEEIVKQIMDQHVQSGESDEIMSDETVNKILEDIFKRSGRQNSVIRRISWRRVAVVAVLAMVSGGVYWLAHRERIAEELAVVNPKVEVISPGGDKALLTLGDGRTIDLDGIPNGALRQNGVRAVKDEGLIRYTAASDAGKDLSAESRFNTLTTPRGGQYQLVLQDGSRVWLNAESSLKFPEAFGNNSRDVELTGEAYFEIKQLSSSGRSGKIPFNINVHLPSGKMGRITVLGTHFNVNAYANEKRMKTTLLEGAIRVGDIEQDVLLKPGQQAEWPMSGSIKINNNADLEEAVAWKEGLFYFDNVDINNIMRQVGRWYDVQVVYKRSVSPRRFVGKIKRSAELKEVLEILRLSEIDFTIENKTIVVH